MEGRLCGAWPGLAFGAGLLRCTSSATTTNRRPRMSDCCDDQQKSRQSTSLQGGGGKDEDTDCWLRNGAKSPFASPPPLLWLSLHSLLCSPLLYSIPKLIHSNPHTPDIVYCAVYCVYCHVEQGNAVYPHYCHPAGPRSARLFHQPMDRPARS